MFACRDSGGNGSTTPQVEDVEEGEVGESGLAATPAGSHPSPSPVARNPASQLPRDGIPAPAPATFSPTAPSVPPHAAFLPHIMGLPLTTSTVDPAAQLPAPSPMAAGKSEWMCHACIHVACACAR